MAEVLIERREADVVQQLGAKRRAELEELRNAFKSKGTVGLWWDSKVSENDKKKYYFYFFSMKSTDKEKVVSEIKKFEDIFGKLETVSECSFDEMEKLDEEVREMKKFAQEELKAAESDTIYQVCKAFVSSGVENELERVKNAYGAYEFKKLRRNMGEIVRVEADRLNRECKVENEILRNVNESTKNQIEELRESNEAALRQLKIENEERVSKLEKVLEESRRETIRVRHEVNQEKINREKMEKRMKEKSEIETRELEKKLKRQSIIRWGEREEYFMAEMMAMTEQMNELIKVSESLKLGSINECQSCPNLFSANSSLDASLTTIDERETASYIEPISSQNDEHVYNTGKFA